MLSNLLCSLEFDLNDTLFNKRFMAFSITNVYELVLKYVQIVG